MGGAPSEGIKKKDMGVERLKRRVGGGEKSNKNRLGGKAFGSSTREIAEGLTAEKKAGIITRSEANEFHARKG